MINQMDAILPEALERLRQQRAKRRSVEFEGGKAEGRRWAMDDTDGDDHKEHYLQMLQDEFSEGPESLDAQTVAEAIGGDPEGVWGVSGDELSGRYVAGWVAGAVEIASLIED